MIVNENYGSRLIGGRFHEDLSLYGARHETADLVVQRPLKRNHPTASYDFFQIRAKDSLM